MFVSGPFVSMMITMDLAVLIVSTARSDFLRRKLPYTPKEKGIKAYTNHPPAARTNPKLDRIPAHPVISSVHSTPSTPSNPPCPPIPLSPISTLHTPSSLRQPAPISTHPIRPPLPHLKDLSILPQNVPNPRLTLHLLLNTLYISHILPLKLNIPLTVNSI
jgi:hypothetical protein